MKDGELYITKSSRVTCNSIYKIHKIIKNGRQEEKIIVNSTICLEGLLPIPTDHGPPLKHQDIFKAK